MGLREHGVRLQNLVVTAEYRFVELLPPAERGGDRSKWPEGHLLGLSKEMVYKLRKVYGGLAAGVRLASIGHGGQPHRVQTATERGG